MLKVNNLSRSQYRCLSRLKLVLVVKKIKNAKTVDFGPTKSFSINYWYVVHIFKKKILFFLKNPHLLLLFYVAKSSCCS